MGGGGELPTLHVAVLCFLLVLLPWQASEPGPANGGARRPPHNGGRPGITEATPCHGYSYGSSAPPWLRTVVGGEAIGFIRYRRRFTIGVAHFLPFEAKAYD